MNLEQTAAVLGKAATIDNRRQADSVTLAWHEVIGDLDFRDALDAVAEHRRTSTEYLMPAHVRRIAERLRGERREREIEQERRHELEAYAAQAGPLKDRSADILALVTRVRSILPEGNVEALHPRREHWRREHEAFQRQANAQPNPHYRAAAGETTEVS